MWRQGKCMGVNRSRDTVEYETNEKILYTGGRKFTKLMHQRWISDTRGVF